MLQTQIDLNKACQKGWRPPEKLDLDDWADKYRYINEVSGEKWFTSTVEVARGPMKAVTEIGVRTITVMCSTQTLKTELILNTIGYFMDVDPCPMLVVQPKDEIAKRFSNVRLKQMLRASPVLRNLVEESRRRDASDTASHKEFPGGHVTIVGSRSPGNLAMLPIRVVLLDEIDKYEESSGAEGDPIDLAEERMATYSANSLSIRVCSPTTKGLSRIEESYETSDMRKPFAVCPHCNEKQIMMWKNVKWDKDDKGNSKAETAQYCCIHCGVLWTEGQRLEALQGITWRQTAEFACSECEHINQPEKWKPTDGHKWQGVRAICEECGKGKCPNKHAGFWASKLYSPFRPLSELVERWIEAQGNIEKLKAFINTQLAETFEETGDQITSVEGLLARREPYDELPGEVGVITAGVDVQNNRLEMEVVGWGMDEESWSLDYHIIPGDPHKPQVWMELDEKLNKIYHRDDGRISLIAATCIDLGGGHTQEVAAFCKDKIERRVWPIRGIASAGRPYPVWPKNPGRTAKISLPFYNVGVDAGKNVIFSRMMLQEPGPGYCHLPKDRDLSWFEQFTAERRVQRRKGTQMYYVWENKRNARNESFDIRNYAYAALCGLQSMGWSVNIITEEQRLIMDSEYEEILEKRVTDTAGRQATSSPRRRIRRVNKSSYASR